MKIRRKVVQFIAFKSCKSSYGVQMMLALAESTYDECLSLDVSFLSNRLKVDEKERATPQIVRAHIKQSYQISLSALFCSFHFPSKIEREKTFYVRVLASLRRER